MANAQPAAPSVEVHRLVGDGGIPNNPDRPLLVYRAALQANGADLAAAFEQLFASHGWGGGWRNGATVTIISTRRRMRCSALRVATRRCASAAPRASR